MKIKSYHIASPEQLNELGVLAKDTERLKQIRSVWSIARRKKGKSPWDHAIFAEFYSYGNTRKAVIVRISVNNDEVLVADLKYNAALKWCKDHLKLEREEEDA